MMSTLSQRTLSRRGVLVGALTVGTPLLAFGSALARSNPPTPIDLGNGIEVRGFRLFPTHGATQFLVEIHNTTSQAIDTPAVGVRLPHLDPDRNFGWASPISLILYPHHSDCLVGVAPAALASDDDWNEPEWVLCNEIRTVHSDKVSNWDLEISHSIDIRSPQLARVDFEVINHSTSNVNSWFYVQGLVWDEAGLISGAMLPVPFNGIKGSETVEAARDIAASLEHRVHPLTLLDDLEGISVALSIQYQYPLINPPCSPIMPWNQ